MSNFNQYGTYYDPVGNQASRPSGYSYSTSPSTAAYPNAASSSGYGTGYDSSYQRGDGNAFNSQQYRPPPNQQAASSATHAAAALSSLSSQGYNQASTSTRASSSNQYDNGSWFAQGSNSNAYSVNDASAPSRTQSNNSPLYPTAQASSTFGKISVPEQTQSTSNTYTSAQPYQSTTSTSASSNRTYQTVYTQQQTQPPRYNSPLHAVQAQQRGHGKQTPRSSNQTASPKMAQVPASTRNRQQSASVEPSPMTVDPSQVYDNRAELQRKAQIEAERRRKYEDEQATKKAEEERVVAEKKKEEEEAAQAAAKKAEQERKNAQRRKAREEKKQSKSAASTLQQMASGTTDASPSGLSGDEEAQMRAMFQKMREFNAKNPELLAKLWDEERKTHEAAKAQSPPHHPAGKAAPSTTPAPPSAHTQKQAAKAAAKAVPPPKAPSAISDASSVKERAAAAPSKPDRIGAGANTSLWPPHKKSSLSEATAKWLNAMPANANVHVTSQTILDILNDNPSYVELCRSLEGLGLKFDRSQLARELLKAVPDGIKGQPVPQPTTPLSSISGTAPQVNGSSASSGSAKARGRPRKDSTNTGAATSGLAAGTTVNYEAPISLSEAAREVNSMGQRFSHGSPMQPYQTPYITQSPTLSSGNRPQSQSQVPEVKPGVKPEQPPRPPADKEEAARKRTFGDLVDLTAEESDDEGPPAKKVLLAPMAQNNGHSNHPHSLQKPIPFNQFMFNPSGQSLATSPYFPLPSNGQMPPRASLPGQQQALNAIGHTGQPTPPPLPPLKQKGPTPEQLQQARMRGKMLVEPIMRDRVARKSNYDSRTIARDVLLATGRHPDMRGLNAHLTNMHKLLAAHGGEFDSGGNRSDLATIRWDLIDPLPSKEAKAEATLKPDNMTVESRPPPIDPLPYLNKPKYGSSPLSQDRILKRRGRPPKQRESNLLTNGLGAPGSTTPAREASSRPTTPSSAPAPAMSSSASIGYAAFQQTNPNGTKKKGRPFGWKKNMHSREAQGLPKASNPAKPSRLKQSTTPKQAQEVEPHYQEYKCRWDECSASLMNLDTLKKHLVKVHGKENGHGEYLCFWEDCKGVKRLGLAAGRVPAKYDNIEEWMKHMDTAHVSSIAWKLGDGPKGGVAYDTSLFYSLETTPSYLTDSRGRSVTPIISPPVPVKPLPAQTTAAETIITESSPQPAVKQRGRPPKHGGPPKVAVTAPGGIENDPELSKLAQHQRLVGPLMDRMGCVLASEQRRQTFLDDEDFEDEGWGSEHDVRESA